MKEIYMLLTAEQHGMLVFDILERNIHQPIKKGKCNRDKIEEHVTVGILAGALPPMKQEDVNWVIRMIDTLIKEGKY